MSQKKDNKGLVIFIVIAVLAALLACAELVNGLAKARRERAPKPQKSAPAIVRIFGHDAPSQKRISSGRDYIARLYITGTIQEANDTYNQEWLLETIDDLIADRANVGLILDIDSPGGTVYEADEVYLKLLEYRTEKPVYAYFESLAASGGYYIGCAAEYIMANRNSLTGSIGVIAGGFTDLTGLFDKLGIKSETIHSGRNKLMGNYNEPATDEQRQIFQSISDECYEQFTEIVAQSRKMTLPQVRELADGRIYTARQAQQNGLIDAIGTWDDVVAAMQEAVFDGEEYDVEEYKYEMDDFLSNYFRFMKAFLRPGASSAAVLPEAVERAITPEVPYPAYIYTAD